MIYILKIDFKKETASVFVASVFAGTTTVLGIYLTIRVILSAVHQMLLSHYFPGSG